MQGGVQGRVLHRFAQCGQGNLFCTFEMTEGCRLVVPVQCRRSRRVGLEAVFAVLMVAKYGVQIGVHIHLIHAAGNVHDSVPPGSSGPKHLS